MFGFLPVPYPDELLYSVVARLESRLGAQSRGALMSELFGCQRAAAVTDLPAHLSHFCDALPPGAGYSPMRVITEHSNLPYYAPFLPSGRVDQVCMAMTSGSARTVKHRIGLLASTFRANRYFRVCPACVETDQDSLGESYWRRLHQLLGVEVCPDHLMFLQETWVPATNRTKRTEFLAVPNAAVDLPRTQVNVGNPEHDQLLKMARDIRWLLTNGMKNGNRLAGIHQRYANHLAKQRLASQQGRVHLRELHKAVLQRYGTEFLERVQAQLDVTSRSSWLCRLLWGSTEAHHPVRHLLLIHFLGKCLPDFLSEEPRGPFGEGPWPCLNPACRWFRQPVVLDCEAIRDKRTGQIRGTFGCACGFSYTRWGPDPDGVECFEKTRVRTFGPVWTEKVEGLLRAGTGIKRAAHIMDVDVKTIHKHRMNQNSTHGPIHVFRKDSQDAKAHHREAWREAQKEYPTAGRSELRKIVPRSHDWLVRTDRQWYELNSPPGMRSRPKTRRVNWEERDESWARAIQEVVVSSTTSSSKRWSKHVLACTIGCHGLLENRLDRLPRTAAVLAELDDAITERSEMMAD